MASAMSMVSPDQRRQALLAFLSTRVGQPLAMPQQTTRPADAYPAADAALTAIRTLPNAAMRSAAMRALGLGNGPQFGAFNPYRSPVYPQGNYPGGWTQYWAQHQNPNLTQNPVATSPSPGPAPAPAVAPQLQTSRYYAPGAPMSPDLQAALLAGAAAKYGPQNFTWTGFSYLPSSMIR